MSTAWTLTNQNTPAGEWAVTSPAHTWGHSERLSYQSCSPEEEKGRKLHWDMRASSTDARPGEGSSVPEASAGSCDSSGFKSQEAALVAGTHLPKIQQGWVTRQVRPWKGFLPLLLVHWDFLSTPIVIRPARTAFVRCTLMSRVGLFSLLSCKLSMALTSWSMFTA